MLPAPEIIELAPNVIQASKLPSFCGLKYTTHVAFQRKEDEIEMPEPRDELANDCGGSLGSLFRRSIERHNPPWNKQKRKESKINTKNKIKYQKNTWRRHTNFRKIQGKENSALQRKEKTTKLGAGISKS
jgi:hypothetical protein